MQIVRHTKALVLMAAAIAMFTGPVLAERGRRGCDSPSHTSRHTRGPHGGGSRDRTRLECRARGMGDISMSGRFEDRRMRQKFSVEFEAAPGGDFVDGDVLDIHVDGMMVGEMMLMQTLGDVVGDFDLDTTAQPDDDDLPFPDGFPEVSVDTEIEVVRDGETVLGCSLSTR